MIFTDFVRKKKGETARAGRDEGNLKRDLKLLDEVYPEIHIERVLVAGDFDPNTIQEISKRYRVPQNYMFIGHPSQNFPYRLEELGGVRLIV